MIYILYASETGNAESIAEDAELFLSKAGIESRLLDMDDAQVKDLEATKICLAVVSTWGDGDPPSTGEDFFTELQDSPTSLAHMSFCVYALGDLGYDQFCQFGKDLEAEFLAHGAHKALPLVENDVDFEENFDTWISQVKQLIEGGKFSASEEAATV